MKVFVINTLTEFNKYYKSLKEYALINDSPRTYLIGLDCEMINRTNDEESYKHAKGWIKDDSSDN